MKLLVKGWPAGAGKATGMARVIMFSHKAQSLKHGDILVTRITDTTMFVGIIQHAAGIVTDLGGVNSHPAIVARELGIPCVVATKKATVVIATGMKIMIDGQKGEVYEAD